VNVPLRDWMSRYHPDWKLNQAIFVRDRIAPLVGAGLDYEDWREPVRVVGEHCSKSVHLPVYEIERPEVGIRITLRNNFHDWKISVLSARPVGQEADFSSLFHTTPPVAPDYTGDELHSAYFEGFPRDRIFGYYSADPARFSACVGHDFELWAVVRAVMRGIGVIKPLTWHTAESHAKELAAQRDRWLARESASRRRNDRPRDLSVDPLELRARGIARGFGRKWWGGRFSGEALFSGDPLPLP
jgi:hypothetical protein